ncbi:hypothetical protein ACLKA6_015553 [Drosophila palustris]
MERVLDDDDKLDVSYEILEFLGIADRPMHHKNHGLSLRKSAPKFLLDVYHRITAEEGLTNNINDDDHKRTKRDVDELDNGNEQNFHHRSGQAGDR